MRPDTTADNVVAMYHHYIAELSQIGIIEFKLSPRKSRRIAHEVLMVSIGARSRIENMQAWLTASMRAAARLESHAEG